MSIGRWAISTISRWAFGVAALDGLRGVTSIFHHEFRIFHHARGCPSRSCARSSRATPILGLCTHRRAMRGAAAGHGGPHRGTGPGRPSRAPRPARRQGQRHNGSCSLSLSLYLSLYLSLSIYLSLHLSLSRLASPRLASRCRFAERRVRTRLPCHHTTVREERIGKFNSLKRAVLPCRAADV